MTIRTHCPVCHEDDFIDLTDEETEAYFRWRRKELLIQEALPDRSPAEREQLVTGICPSCWDNMFGGNEDEERA